MSGVEYLIRAKEILKWMEMQDRIDSPSMDSNDDRERLLAKNLIEIKLFLIKPYEIKKENKEENHYEEIKKIVNEIEKYKDITDINSAKSILMWMKETNAKGLPNINSEDEQEKMLAKKLMRLTKYMNITENKDSHTYIEINKILREIYNYKLPVRLEQANQILIWVKENNRMPSATSKDKNERKLGQNLGNIKIFLIKPYEELKTEEEKKEYKKRHPEFDEVKKILNEIEKIKNNGDLPKKLQQAINIKNWMIENNTLRTPNKHSLNKRESELGKQLDNIKYWLLSPYERLKTEEEKNEYKRKHPEIEDVKKIIDEIYSNKYKEIEYVHDEKVKDNKVDDEEIER